MLISTYIIFYTKIDHLSRVLSGRNNAKRLSAWESLLYIVWAKFVDPENYLLRLASIMSSSS